MIIACIISFLIGAFAMFTFIAISASLKEDKTNKVHFYVTRDEDGFLALWLGKPFRAKNKWVTNTRTSLLLTDTYRFCSYNLNRKDYKDIKWKDEPVEVFLNLED